MCLKGKQIIITRKMKLLLKGLSALVCFGFGAGLANTVLLITGLRPACPVCDQGATCLEVEELMLGGRGGEQIKKKEETKNAL